MQSGFAPAPTHVGYFDPRVDRLVRSLADVLAYGSRPERQAALIEIGCLLEEYECENRGRKSRRAGVGIVDLLQTTRLFFVMCDSFVCILSAARTLSFTNKVRDPYKRTSD